MIKNKKAEVKAIGTILLLIIVTMTSAISGSSFERGYDKQDFPTEITLTGLSTPDNITWLGWKGSTFYSNSSGVGYETMTINIIVNGTQNVSAINISCGNLYGGASGWINGSNLSIWIADDAEAGWSRPDHDLGNGDGYYIDAMYENITLNATTCNGMALSPFVHYGDGTNITQNTTLKVRFQIDIPNDKPPALYTNETVWHVFAIGSDLDYEIFNAKLDLQQYVDLWYIKSGFNNATHGPPDFSKHQDNWGVGYWTYCGVVSAMDALWWCDLKRNNRTHDWFIPDYTSASYGSKHPNNVIPLGDKLAIYLNTSLTDGTSVDNMTQGLNDALDIWNVSGAYNITHLQNDSYENITTRLQDCEIAVAYIHYWTGDGVEPSPGDDYGGHYVTIIGYNASQQNDTVPGALLFSDSEYDNAELGGMGFSYGNQGLGNGSYNWTQNVSYDGYWCQNHTFGGEPTVSVLDYPPDYTPFYSFVEHIWYIEELMDVDTNKSVWNNSGGTWENHIEQEFVENNSVTFNISWHNNGTNMTYNITVLDTFYDYLEYTNGTSVFYHPNGTSYSREPDYMSFEGAPGPWHGHLHWNFTNTELMMDYCEIGYIHFNCSVNDTGINDNALTVYFFEEGMLDHEYWDVNIYNQSNCTVGSQYVTTIECPCEGVEESEWNLSEHPQSATLDNPFDWQEYEPARWQSYNETTDGTLDNWSWAYRYDNNDGNGGDGYDLSYTIENKTSANRTQSIVRMRLNYTEEFEAYVGVVYSFINNTNYDMVLYGDDVTYLLTMSETGLVNTQDGSVVVDDIDAYNYWTVGWPCNPAWGEYVDPDGDLGGIWVKTIYNQYPGHIQSKAWDITKPSFDLCFEQPGWIVDNMTGWGVGLEYPFIQSDRSSCFGLVIWNPNDIQFVADFDMVDMWRLNYSRDEQANASILENRSIYGSDGIPLITFPTFNRSYKINNITLYDDCYQEYLAGNFTMDEFYDCVVQTGINLSSLFNMESRAYKPNASCGDPDEWDEQNDTIYYYTSTLTNITGQEYTEMLAIQIEDTTDGSQDDFDSVIICIDVDNNLQWDDNDVAIVWWSWFDPFFFTWQTNYTAYKGTTDIGVASGISVTASYEECISAGWFYNFIPPLHRYTFHRIYSIEAPRYYLEKHYVGSGQYINENDTFGLNIMTVNRGLDALETLTAVWENWNETYNSSVNEYYSCDDSGNHLTVWDNYMNISTDVLIEDFYNGIWTGVNESRMALWGHGRIEGWELQDTFFSINATKECNTTQITGIADWNLVWYNITVCNDGQGNVTDVVVNDTLPPGCSFFSSSLPADNETGSDRNWTFNLTSNLVNNTCINFTLTINVSANAAPSGTFLYNYVNATVSQAGVFALANDSFQYGSNNAPIINWTYPANTSIGVDLMLANMSCYVYDPDGNDLSVQIGSNKTTAWSSDWNLVGAVGEFFLHDDGSAASLSTTKQFAQSFTIGTNGSNVTFNISQIKIKAYRFGSPGVLIVNVTTMNGSGFPNMSNVLATGTINANSWTTSTDGEWYTINMSGYELQPGAQYAFVIYGPSVDGTNRVNWCVSFSGGYEGGNLTYNAGSWVWTVFDGAFQLFSNASGNGVYVCNQSFNNTQRFNTRWRWGNTTYYWWINITDGVLWTNESFIYRTEYSRYDVNSGGDVTATDVSIDWSNRAGAQTYLGVYDVDASGDVTATDCSLIWANRS